MSVIEQKETLKFRTFKNFNLLPTSIGLVVLPVVALPFSYVSYQFGNILNLGKNATEAKKLAIGFLILYYLLVLFGFIGLAAYFITRYIKKTNNLCKVIECLFRNSRLEITSQVISKFVSQPEFRIMLTDLIIDNHQALCQTIRDKELTVLEQLVNDYQINNRCVVSANYATRTTIANILKTFYRPERMQIFHKLIMESDAAKMEAVKALNEYLKTHSSIPGIDGTVLQSARSTTEQYIRACQNNA